MSFLFLKNLLNEEFVLDALEIPYEKNPLIFFLFLTNGCVEVTQRRKKKKNIVERGFGISHELNAGSNTSQITSSL